MDDRIKKLRKALGLTQQEFADKLGVSRVNIAGYESNTRRPSDAAISLMCREFNVNEAWLRTGDGDMFADLSREDELADFFADLLDTDDVFKQRFIVAISKLDSSWWKMLEQAAREAVGKTPGDD